MEAEKQAFKSLMHFDIDGIILFTDFRGHISAKLTCHSNEIKNIVPILLFVTDVYTSPGHGSELTALAENNLTQFEDQAQGNPNHFRTG